MTKNNPQAFPVPEYQIKDGDKVKDTIGMSLRDYFAGQALVGFISVDAPYEKAKELALWCYEMADAMIEEREKYEE